MSGAGMLEECTAEQRHRLQATGVGGGPGVRFARLLMKAYFVLSVPLAITFILTSAKIHPAYRMTLARKWKLGLNFFRNRFRIPTGSSYKSHLAMALKILETPPDVEGDIVECGTWKGGSAANLSLVCRITGRRLRIFDSFEGLPPVDPSDRGAHEYAEGDYRGALEEVRDNIERCGAIECCEFVRGWFDETLPRLDAPVLLAYLDVDLESSLETCVRYLWPNLTDEGYLFIDEFLSLDYCSLFFSERYWETTFNRPPPGLIGAGIGLALGEYYIGPASDRWAHPTQHANAAAYTRKDLSAHWTYFPSAPPASRQGA